MATPTMKNGGSEGEPRFSDERSSTDAEMHSISNFMFQSFPEENLKWSISTLSAALCDRHGA
jgi:hypothetical protein